MPSTSVARKDKDNLEAKPDKPSAVTPKVTAAIHAMVWLGLPRDKAAAKAGISAHGLYKAFRNPSVKAAYIAECEVLRLSGKARRIHRLDAIAEQDDNKQAAVNAILALERLGPDDNAASSMGSHRSPGVVVIIQQGGPQVGSGTQLTHPPPLIINNADGSST